MVYNRGDSDLAVGGLSLALGFSYVVEVLILYILLNAKTKMVSFNNTVKPFLIKLLNTILMGIGMYLLFKLSISSWIHQEPCILFS
jgi:hypothetical protein